MKLGSLFAATIVASVLASVAHAGPLSGPGTDLDNAAVLKKQKALVQVELLTYREKEVRGLTPAQVDALNEQSIAELKSLKIERRTEDRTVSITREDAQSFIYSIDAHPVVAGYNYRKYSPPGREIGFCFGRAAYAHILGLQIGVQKDAIKKAWVVGPMRNGGINWAFHVTTLMKSGDEWLAVDNFPGGQVLTVEEWLKYMQPMSTDHKLRLYITEPQKFVGPFRYDSIQFGANLPREKDWYSGYFKDLMAWFATNPDLTQIGLPTPADFKAAHKPAPAL